METKIKSIESYSGDNICLVRITDGDGAQGWGMTAPFAANISALVLHQIAAGTAFASHNSPDVNDFTDVADEVIRRNYKYLGTFLARAAAGIDTALWDLEAKKKGVSAAVLAGKKSGRDYIDLYASSMKRDLPVREEADRLREIQDKFGYRAIKLHPGIPVGRDRDFWDGRTEDMVRAMIETARPGTEIYVDVNGNYSVEKAIETARFLHDCGVKFFEEPCPYWKTEETKAVRDACEKIGIPVAGGEQDYIDTVWENMIERRVMDICQPDLLYLGGFSRSLRVAKLAASKNLPVTPHTSNRSPIFIMGLHYMAHIDNPYPFLECGIEEDLWATECYTPQIIIKDGRAAVPDGPGWGFEPDEDFLAKAHYQISRND
ncbi:MAG: mandelate racemase/muconate lactonizing enzyme family protein [Oscillospiraceae bacterium]|nr:mandelate racemase/muconate lactonizing enzyme family protein [Oscillospiraceae bacterium]